MARLLIDDSGASLVEFTLIVLLLLQLTFGIAELGHLFWQWNSAEKATQLASRLAVVSDPVAAELKTFDCKTSSIPLGTPCSDPNAATFGTVTCSGATSSCGSGFNFDADAFNALLTRMQEIFPVIQASNLVVEYQDLRLCFAGIGHACPAVTVRLSGMTYSFILVDALFGLDPIAMPDFRATLTSEDINSDGAD